MSLLNQSNLFTKEAALQYQSEDLGRWQLVLNETAYNELVKFCSIGNESAKTGYDIPRGETITKYVDELTYKRRELLIRRK
jgi:hypothetical protein